MGDGEAPADCVKVAVRCRPPSSKEINNGETCIVEMVESFTEGGEAGQVVLTDPSGVEKPAEFAFDIVFGLKIEQIQIYHSVGRPALMKTFEGYNGTIFAYGQTGSGKSWSMTGGAGDLRGITPRVNVELFERIEQEQVGTRKFLVMCSYFEIYNEIIFDLLNPVSDRAKLGGGLQIKEHPVMGIYVKDLTEIVVENAEKLDGMIDSGSKNRAVSSTMMNASSSRSHSIFTIKIHQKDEEDASRNVFAKLNLVDLAGSERQKGTGASGQTLKEGANINKSLSALGNVINALVEGANGKKVFIPYRNSKLTRVLQESLGGNSLCTMLATLSPAACNYEETMSTLRYANRAKAIKVSATKNEEASQISRLKAEVEELKKKLASAGGGGPGGLSEEERQSEKEKHEKQLKEMENMLNSNWGAKQKLSEEHERTMQKLAEDRIKAAQALEEERTKRLRLLQEKNDLELTVKGLLDFMAHVPKMSNTPAVLTGDQPRQWLKLHRTIRQHLDQLREQRTMVMVFQRAFDEDVRLWGEGAETLDMSLTLGGLNRCLPKLDKLRKGGEKLLQLEAQGLSATAEVTASVTTSIAELESFREQLSAGDGDHAGDVAEDGANTDPSQQDQQVVRKAITASMGQAGAATGTNAREAAAAALDEVDRMLTMVEKQVAEKADEITQLSSVDLGETCGLVLQSSQSCPGQDLEEGAEVKKHCETLQALVADPRLASLPACMPAKPLREYDASDVLDTPETTEALLGQLIRWEGFCGGKKTKSALELLTRPPPKFLSDVVVSIQAATGFPPGLSPDWPETREERLDRFQRVVDAVVAQFQVQIDFDPADVLKGKEVPKTLRLLQLVAVAAAKQQPAEAAADGTPVHRGVARPRQLPAFLDAVDRCIQVSKALAVKYQSSNANAAGSNPADGEESYEERIAKAELQLQEEARARVRQDELVADIERQLQEAQAEVRKVTNEVENASATAGSQANQEQLALEQQLGELQEANSPEALSEETVVRMLTTQLEEVRRELQRDEASVREFEERQQELERSVNEALRVKEQLEAEVERERQRREVEEQLAGQAPEEQKLILKAHEQKLLSRVEALEAQITQIQVEAEERKAHVLRLNQEKIDLEKSAEDANLQMQIVQEERDAMREAMEQLFNEYAAVEEELANHQQAYINLSERLCSQQDDYNELEALVERKRQEVAGLQKNGFHLMSAA